MYPLIEEEDKVLPFSLDLPWGNLASCLLEGNGEEVKMLDKQINVHKLREDILKSERQIFY